MTKLQKTIRTAMGSWQPGTTPAHFIAESIEAKFLIIDRDELPTVEIKDGVATPAGAASGWSVDTANLESNRAWGLEYLAAVEAIRQHRVEQGSKRAKRRDELAKEVAAKAGWNHPNSARYATHQDEVQAAINMIIDLEAAHE